MSPIPDFQYMLDEIQRLLGITPYQVRQEWACDIADRTFEKMMRMRMWEKIFEKANPYPEDYDVMAVAYGEMEPVERFRLHYGLSGNDTSIEMIRNALKMKREMAEANRPPVALPTTVLGLRDSYQWLIRSDYPLSAMGRVFEQHLSSFTPTAFAGVHRWAVPTPNNTVEALDEITWHLNRLRSRLDEAGVEDPSKDPKRLKET